MSSAAVASFLHIVGIAAGFVVLLGRSWYLGDSALFRAWRWLERRVDLSMMWLATRPPPEQPHLDEARMRRVLAFDTLALLVSGVWVGSGLWRLLAGLDKSAAWYAANDLFLVKMGLVGALLLLEMVPMTVFIQWRYSLALRDERARRAAAGDDRPVAQGPLMRLFLRFGEGIALGPLPWVRRVHAAEELLLLVILLTATHMARGVGYDAFGAPAGETASAACRVERVFSTACVQCHAGAASQGGLDLGDRRALFASSSQWPTLTRVVAGAPEASLLFEKVAGPTAHGARMPLGGALPPEQVEAVRAWIADGAPACEP